MIPIVEVLQAARADLASQNRSWKRKLLKLGSLILDDRGSLLNVNSSVCYALDRVFRRRTPHACTHISM